MPTEAARCLSILTSHSPWHRTRTHTAKDHNDNNCVLAIAMWLVTPTKTEDFLRHQSMVVETETGRDESEAAAATASAMDDGPCGESEGGGDAAAKAVGAKDAGEGDEPKEEEEDGRDREEEEEEAAKRGWSEIRLAIEELSAVDVERRGGKPPPPSPPPPTLTFLALSHLLLQVLGEFVLSSPALPPRISSSFNLVLGSNFKNNSSFLLQFFHFFFPFLHAIAWFDSSICHHLPVICIASRFFIWTHGDLRALSLLLLLVLTVLWWYSYMGVCR